MVYLTVQLQTVRLQAVWLHDSKPISLTYMAFKPITLEENLTFMINLVLRLLVFSLGLDTTILNSCRRRSHKNWIDTFRDTFLWYMICLNQAPGFGLRFSDLNFQLSFAIL